MGRVTANRFDPDNPGHHRSQVIAIGFGVSHDDDGSATRPPLTVRFRHAL
jgi:hypothetical protein